MPQFPALTALRFIAALLVFLFHFAPRGALWDIVAGEGHIGVNIFFVLSGFLITLRYREGLVRGDVRMADYFLRRAARILPLYYVIFVLSSLFAGGGFPLGWARLPEWTLTQALFSPSLNFLIVTTSWTLTVEECFYALAPWIYRAQAAAQTRWTRAPFFAGIVVLILLVAGLYAIGAVVATLFAGTDFGFLNTARYVSIHTLFGRFYDFAAGILAAMAFRRARLRDRFLFPRATTAAAMSILTAGLILVGEAGMHAAGGIDGPRWLAVWLWNLELAPATALLILSLTSPANPMARALGAAPFVYLGKISYALYLVQFTPIGKGLLYPLLPRDPLLSVILLYVAQNAISAVFFELVEEPARRGILRLAGREGEPPEPHPPGARIATGVVIAIVLTLQCATWRLAVVNERQGPMTLDEVTASGPTPEDLLPVGVTDGRYDEGLWLIRLPDDWGEGWASRDARAPSTLRVFADGRAVAFARSDRETGEAAFFRGPRKGSLALRLERPPAHLVVIRERPLTRLRAQWARLTREPREGAVLAAVFLMALLLGLTALRGGAPSPRAALVATLGAGLAWGVLSFYDSPWTPAVLVIEGVVLAVTAALTPIHGRAGRIPRAD